MKKKGEKLEGRFCIHCTSSVAVKDAPMQCSHKTCENDPDKSCYKQRKDPLSCGPEGLYHTTVTKKKEAK